LQLREPRAAGLRHRLKPFSVTSPHLAVEHVHKLAPSWFDDTNVSRAQIIARPTTAARLTGLRYGEDVTIIEG